MTDTSISVTVSGASRENGTETNVMNAQYDGSAMFMSVFKDKKISGCMLGEFDFNMVCAILNTIMEQVDTDFFLHAIAAVIDTKFDIGLSNVSDCDSGEGDNGKIVPFGGNHEE